MKQIPWITLVIAVLFFLSPLGREILHNSLLSGEALSRNIAMPIFLIAVAILIALAFFERWIYGRIWP